MHKIKNLFLVGLFFCLSACASPTLDHYKDMEPAFNFQEYFNGPIKAWGIIQDRQGHVQRRFNIDLHGSWKGDVGTLKEKFSFYDGEVDYRTWTLTKIGENEYRGEADDLTSIAYGKIEGNALHWVYEMDIQYGDTDENTITITLDEWMWRMKDGGLMNRSKLKKFGFTVGELTIFMQKQ